MNIKFPAAALPAPAGEILCVTCRFTSIEPGQYAVAVMHDLNGNHRTDTKMFGIPTEDWGVSNNSRPRLRAPNFDEAAFSVAEGKTVAIEIKVGR